MTQNANDQAGTPRDIIEDAGTFQNVPVVIHAQYIKDLSFENPHAPETFLPSNSRPTMDINFSMDARKIEFGDSPSTYEVTLGVQAKATRDDKVAFVIDIQYSVVASLNNVPEDQTHPLLLIEMPRYAFPYVRQLVSTLTQQAGYAPLLLSPIDFRAFYAQRFGAEADAANIAPQSAQA